MSITVKNITYTTMSFESPKKNTYQLTWPATISVTYTKNKKTYVLNVSLSNGFRTDGASVPPVFNWFLPRWDKKNMTYNAGAIVHDCLYTTKGIDGYFSRSEADDFIRGIWRISGINRFKAGVADMTIGWFAGGDEHWGNDTLNNKDLIKMDVIPMD